MQKKKKKHLPHYGYDWYRGPVFAPLYGPWAAITTNPKGKEPEDEPADQEEPGETTNAGAPSAPTPAAPTGGTGGAVSGGGGGGGAVVSHRIRSVADLIEVLESIAR